MVYTTGVKFHGINKKIDYAPTICSLSETTANRMIRSRGDRSSGVYDLIKHRLKHLFWQGETRGRTI